MRQNLNFTQIGSLPFSDTAKALDYSLMHDIPFLPELILKGDGMFDYIKDPGKLSCLLDFQKQKFDVVKIQCIGPVTLMQHPSHNYSVDEAVDRIYRHIDTIIQGLDAKKIILFLDEPGLGYSGMDFNALHEPIFASFSNTIKGVHVCGNMQWDLLLKSNIDIISFDASKYDITPFYNERTKQLAWGINNETSIRGFKDGDLITPPCGLSPKYYSEEGCMRIFRELKRISDSYKNR